MAQRTKISLLVFWRFTLPVPVPGPYSPVSGQVPGQCVVLLRPQACQAGKPQVSGPDATLTPPGPGNTLGLGRQWDMGRSVVRYSKQEWLTDLTAEIILLFPDPRLQVRARPAMRHGTLSGSLVKWPKAYLGVFSVQTFSFPMKTSWHEWPPCVHSLHSF